MPKRKGGQRTIPEPGEKRPAASPSPPYKYRHVCNGQIRFEFTDEQFAIRQGWNPGSLSRENRTAIAAELRQIADKMDQDMFEEDGKYHRHPLP